MTAPEARPMTPDPDYAERLAALRVYVGAREAEAATADPSAALAADEAYERYAAIRDQSGPAREAEIELDL